MSQSKNDGGFHTANPHALAIILEASETQSIIAARDIFDINGMKLWARDQPVSQDLQRRLMDRALQQPLEACLVAEDGISPQGLRDAVQALLDAEGPLTPLLRQHAQALQQGAQAVRLHPVVQLMLSASQKARPALFTHAVEAMAVAGALMHAQSRGGSTGLVAAAMTSGLVHDIGEMYIAPEYGEADTDHAPDLASYQQLVVHPHIGQLLLAQLTDYPKDIVRAVAEHHERLDGSGYPHCLQGEQISPLGRLLAATEMALSALRQPGATLHHASVALRVVPGEFDEHLGGPLASAARAVTPLTPRQSAEDLLHHLNQLDIALQGALNRLETVLPLEPSAGLQRAADLSRHLLRKLRQGWNESGLWSPSGIGVDLVGEAEAVQDALRARLHNVERMARLSAGALSADDEDVLDQLCLSLTADMR